MINRIWEKLYRRLFGEYKYWTKKGAHIDKNFITVGKVNLGSEPYLITIGKNVKFSSNCRLITHDGGMHTIRNKYLGYENSDLFGNIIIHDNVFLGINVIILAGVTIGNNCIIGAGSIVTKDIPDGEVWAGVPAHKICTLDEYFSKHKNSIVMTKSLNSLEKKIFLSKENEKCTKI